LNSSIAQKRHHSVLEAELGVGPSELRMGAGGAPSAAAEDGDSTWEDVEEEDEDMAAVMDRSDMVDNQEIVEDVGDNALEAYSNYAKKESRKVSHISISPEDFTDKATRNLRILFFGASRDIGS
jgi:hypothetical protein